MGKASFEAIDISKVFEGRRILNQISFSCEDYTTMAICGQNGSGKSTLLKILAGIYEPTSGKVNRGKKKIGYVPEHFPENLRFKLKEYLLLTAAFQGFSKQQIEADLLEYTTFFGLQSFVNTPLKQCSKGMKQKVGLIQALLTKPDVLLLDEPLTGLDSSSQRRLISILEKLKKQVTIIFTTHEDKMIEKLADKILYVESGMVSRYVQTRNEQKLIKITFKHKDIFTELHALDIIYEGNTALITVEAAKCDELLLDLLHKKCSILEVKEKR
ncbi:ABC transporter ATP-binding protein [Bacillus sp. FJAT-50079]|uniref:ABC transporter ATP-binding protein n=1 Tax=Bacillus sp. FJAT-50079 TaxID=2833577 RepID=UPI001BC8F11D|nr:ABC transporter ATP-binding protein [Bacillus sp. FJAT-50079]MBS4207307.1 ABC transporter ATP-binding protein [Bacillus sp. FJAT-50079]